MVENRVSRKQRIVAGVGNLRTQSQLTQAIDGDFAALTTQIGYHHSFTVVGVSIQEEEETQHERHEHKCHGDQVTPQVTTGQFVKELFEGHVSSWRMTFYLEGRLIRIGVGVRR